MRTPASRWMLIALWATVPNSAWAQSAVALDRFEPATPTSNLVSVADPGVRGRLVPAAGLWLSYADAPLVLVSGSQERSELAEVVDHQLVLHVGASIALARRFEFGANLPWILSQGGDSPTRAGIRFASPNGGALGDLRLSGKVGLFEQHGYLPAVGLLVSTWLPTGKDTAYAGAGRVRFGTDLVLGSDIGPVLWRAALGRRLQDDDAELATAHSGWATSLGAAYRLHQLQLGPELWGTTTADGRVRAFSRRATSVEAVLALRYRWSDFLFSAAAGPGLTPGQGTPRYRVLFGITYAPEQRGRSDAERSSANEVDAEPAQTPERALESSPRPSPAAPLATPVPTVLPASPAAPLARSDTDSDGIVDAVDACPNEPGPANNDTEHHGCPVDRDGDGILDRDDACPDVRGEPSSDPKQHGCKSAVTIQGAQLVLTQQIHFGTGSDEILEDSHEVLLQLKQILAETPDIARVAVDGHTDNVGTENNNLSLSRRRALAVVRWLVANGIDERRLEARGYGPRQPLAANTSADGRAKNRRVEFIILRRTDTGTRGWKDGPVHE